MRLALADSQRAGKVDLGRALALQLLLADLKDGHLLIALPEKLVSQATAAAWATRAAAPSPRPTKSASGSRAYSNPSRPPRPECRNHPVQSFAADEIVVAAII